MMSERIGLLPGGDEDDTSVSDTATPPEHLQGTPPYPAHLYLEKHRRSLALHRLIAEKIRRDPALLDMARENLNRWMAMKPRNHAEPDLIEWRSAIEQGIDATVALMTDPGERATDLRQSAPFTGVLTNDERHAFLAGWRARNPHPTTAKLPMKTVTLGVDEEQTTSTRFAAAMKGEAQGSFITFASAALLFQALAEPRWQILRAMIGVGPQSLGEVAQRVGRDAEALQDAVRALLDTGLLKRIAEGAIVFPYDVVHVDFALAAPQN